MKKNIRNTAAVLCAAALALSAAGCSGGAAAANATPEEIVIPVTVQSPEMGDLAVKNEFIGRVMPDQSVSVFAKMGGEVLAAPFNVGDTVSAGDLLLQVDGKAVQVQVDAALAGYNTAKAGYESAKVNAETQLGTGYDGELIGLEAQLNATRAQYDQAARAVKDYEDENGKDYGEVGSYYRSLRAAKSAAADAFYAAQAALDLAKNGAYDDAVKATEAGLAQAEASLAQAQASYRATAQSLDNLRVTAPISGVIEAKNFNVHDLASQQVPAYVISNKNVMTVTFNVPSGAVPAMELGDAILIENNGTEYTGAIVEVGTIASEQSGLFPVKARIEGDISNLLSGISVKVTASSKKAEGALLVPVSAISHENGKSYLYTVSPDSTAVKTAVEIGISDDTFVEILSGLTSSDRFVATWSPDLTDGVKLSFESVSAPEASEPAAEELEPAGEETAISSSEDEGANAPAASQPASPKTVTSQTAPASSAAPAQSSASSERAGEESTGTPPASERESLVGQAAEGDLPEPLVPEVLEPGDDTEANSASEGE